MFTVFQQDQLNIILLCIFLYLKVQSQCQNQREMIKQLILNQLIYKHQRHLLNHNHNPNPNSSYHNHHHPSQLLQEQIRYIIQHVTSSLISASCFYIYNIMFKYFFHNINVNIHIIYWNLKCFPLFYYNLKLHHICIFLFYFEVFIGKFNRKVKFIIVTHQICYWFPLNLKYCVTKKKKNKQSFYVVYIT